LNRLFPDANVRTDSTRPKNKIEAFFMCDCV
jgi:hypothetical protein